MPDPSDTGNTGLSVVELQAIDSTNNYAHGLIQKGKASHGSLIFAHDQTAGKGQRGRSWQSEKGLNLIMTLLLDPSPLKVSRQFQLSAVVAVSIRDFFAEYAGDGTKIKWPNDLYWQDRKAGGVLIESRIQNQESGVYDSALWKWGIVGIGININQVQFDKHLPNPVSLKQITGKNFDPLALSIKLGLKILNNQKCLNEENGFTQVLKKYNDSCIKKMKQ